MVRYWRVYRTFWTSSLAREMEFRANFFAKVLQNCIWVGFFLLVLLVVYRNTNSVAGWGRGEAFVLVATCFLMSSTFGGLFMSLMEIPEQVRKGTLDFILTKPIDSQLWVSARRFNFDRMGSMFAGVVMLAVGISLTGLHPSFAQWAAYFSLVASALAVFYSLNLALMTTGIWLVRVDNLWVLGETALDVARFPIDIFPTGVRRFLTYALPLALFATLPAEQLTRGVDPASVVLGLGWALAALLLSRAFWRFATRNYSSASS